MEPAPKEFLDTFEAIFKSFGDNDLEDVIEKSSELRANFPDFAESYYTLGLASLALGDGAKALRFMSEGIKVAPDTLEFGKALAALNAMTGNLNDMNYYTKLTLVMESNPLLARIEPEFFSNPESNIDRVSLPKQLVDAWIGYHQRRYRDALKKCEQYWQLRPDDGEANQLMGKIYLALDEPVKALGYLNAAYEILNQSLDCAFDLVDAFLSVGEAEKAYKLLLMLRDAHPKSIELHQGLVNVGAIPQFRSFCDFEEDLSALQVLLRESLSKPVEDQGHDILPKERLTVGVLINEHAMNHSLDFIEGWFQGYNRESIYVVGYQLFERLHVATSRLKVLADDWRPSFDIDDATFKKIICNDGVQVLIDLCGFSAGNRQKLLAGGLPMCRIGWLQGSEVSVPEAHDCTLHDEISIASTHIKCDAVERISLGTVPFAYQGGSVMSPSRSLEFKNAPQSHPVFGGELDVINVMLSAELWSNILRAVPGSLLLLGRIGSIEPELQDHVRNQFKKFDMADRIQFVSGGGGRNGWQEMLSQIDVLLDNVMARGTISTCDALWMGIPVVSLQEDDGSMRYGSSILSAAGRPDWIATDHKSFVAIASDLVKDRSRLKEIQSELKGQVQVSRLCNLNDFAERMENALFQAHEFFMR